jgi:hypothetical protein
MHLRAHLLPRENKDHDERKSSNEESAYLIFSFKRKETRERERERGFKTQ